MVLRDFDLREATITGTIVNDNPAFRRLLTQLKLTEPDVSKLDTSGAGGGVRQWQITSMPGS